MAGVVVTKRLKTEYQSNSGGSRNVSWVYDGVGNRLSEARTGSVVKTTTYSYDANDRLTSEVVTGTGAGTTTYTYDTAGNLTQKDAPGGIEQYAYDDANRLREYTDTASQVTRYAYNHAGIRLSQTQDATGSTPSTTHYLVDPNTAYAQVLEEHSQVGSGTKTLSALYVLGDDRISQYRPAAGSTAASTRHYHADGLGSTRLLTNTSAAVTDRYTYHAFGELDLPGSTVTSPNDFLFTGEQRDPNSGFYYLRARYMNPANGRFTQQDGFGGLAQNPATLNKYVYADDDAANKRDPSGFSSLADVGAAQRVQGSLSTNAVRSTSRNALDIVRKRKMYDIYSYVDWPLHFYMYAERIGTRAGYRYDVGNDLGWKSGAAMVNPIGIIPGGHIQVRPVITRNYLTGRGMKVAALTFGQWYLWHITVVGTEQKLCRVNYPYSVGSGGIDCLSWTVWATAEAIVFSKLPL